MRQLTKRSLSRLGGALVLVMALLSPANALAAPVSHVHYKITATWYKDVLIEYTVAPARPGDVGWRSARVGVGPDDPWEEDVDLEDAYNWGRVLVKGFSSIEQHPDFQCEIWIGGKLVRRGGTLCDLHKY